MKKQTGGGLFDPAEAQIHFVASHEWVWGVGIHAWSLIAVNDLAVDKPGPDTNWLRNMELRSRVEAGNRVLLDSGVFWLTNKHMREHAGLTMDEALALPPGEIEGWDWLWNNYVEMVGRFEPQLWGYIELDQGGAENKRKTRARLEQLGLRPIPVYHPLNDGWDYFDELCSTYDRICVGNVVQARYDTRRHLLATLWERRRRYPDVWVHLLGLTPSRLSIAYPPSSTDSSTWMSAVRYGAESSTSHAMGDAFGRFTNDYSYNPLADPAAGAGGRGHSVRMLAAGAFYMQRTLRDQQDDFRALFGADALLPPVDPREGVRV